MDLSIYLEEAAQVSGAFIIGAIIGIEREFRSKPAGFRTMILICVGACLYTILSKENTVNSPDRIASNIVTGIGFIGAGVIFKDGISVNGLTTAALIWVTAALGMAIGYKNYSLAIVVSIIVVITLFVLEPFEHFISRFHHVKDYRITIKADRGHFNKEMENFFETNKMRYQCIKIFKENDDAIYVYRINIPDKNYQTVNNFLINCKEVKSFES